MLKSGTFVYVTHVTKGIGLIETVCGDSDHIAICSWNRQ